MQGSSSFFWFTHEFSDADGGLRQLAIAYKQPGPIQDGAIDELILEMCKGPNVPDAVAIASLAQDGSVDVLKLIAGPSGSVGLARIKGRIPFLHISIDLDTGKSTPVLLDDAFESRKTNLTKELRAIRKWLDSGLQNLFNAEAVVMHAPAGYEYEKPSGARTPYFLKPDLALTSSATVAFAALAVFHRVFSGSVSRLAEIRVVYVDTMAIAPVAYGLRDLFRLCSEGSSFFIESFHSYTGFDSVDMPLPGTSFCMISASTSMDLHEKWVLKKEVSPDEVITLITLRSATRHRKRALVVIGHPKASTSPGPPQLSIRISGESFLPDQEPPKKVLLTDEYHRSDPEVKLFWQLAGRDVFDVYRRPARAGSKQKALFVEGENLIQQQEFDDWLALRLRNQVKAATRAIVYQNDSSSLKLAEKIAAFCNRELGFDSLSLVPADAIESGSMDAYSGVIIAAAVSGKGSQLLDISRSLRERQSGPRLYIVGFQVAETAGELKTLVSNLEHCKNGGNVVARFGEAAIGTQLLASFDREYETYYHPSSDLSKISVCMRDRGRLLQSTERVGGLSLLPHGTNAVEHMALRAGFAYWPEGYTPSPCQPEVLATVAVLLQRARVSEKLSESRRLSSPSFRHVVLSPENFTRFNDGVIQAAILRCAYPSELDYRSDRSASNFMKSVILRCLDRAEQEPGEALLEFLLALVQRRLQLNESDSQEVFSAARRKRGLSVGLKNAISFILSGPKDLSPI